MPQTSRPDLDEPRGAPQAVGVYERPRSAWLRAHAGLLVGVILSVAGLGIFAFRLL